MTSEATEVFGPITVVLADANVLYSRVLRDYPLYAADEGVIAIRWSRAILSETVEHLQANNSTFDDEQADLLIRLLNAAYPHAEVKPTATARRKVNQFDVPDEDDRHVLAAAVSARADILCTNNVKDFPPEAMASVGIELHDEQLACRAGRDVPHGCRGRRVLRAPSRRRRCRQG